MIQVDLNIQEVQCLLDQGIKYSNTFLYDVLDRLDSLGLVGKCDYMYLIKTQGKERLFKGEEMCSSLDFLLTDLLCEDEDIVNDITLSGLKELFQTGENVVNYHLDINNTEIGLIQDTNECSDESVFDDWDSDEESEDGIFDDWDSDEESEDGIFDDWGSDEESEDESEDSTLVDWGTEDDNDFNNEEIELLDDVNNNTASSNIEDSVFENHIGDSDEEISGELEDDVFKDAFDDWFSSKSISAGMGDTINSGKEDLKELNREDNFSELDCNDFDGLDDDWSEDTVDELEEFVLEEDSEEDLGEGVFDDWDSDDEDWDEDGDVEDSSTNVVDCDNISNIDEEGVFEDWDSDDDDWDEDGFNTLEDVTEDVSGDDFIFDEDVIECTDVEEGIIETNSNVLDNDNSLFDGWVEDVVVGCTEKEASVHSQVDERGKDSLIEQNDAESIPSDIRMYVKTHKNCTITELKKYYSDKDISVEFKKGRISKNGERVFI